MLTWSHGHMVTCSHVFMFAYASDLSNVLIQFVLLAIGGTVWGIVAGILTYRWLSVIFADFQTEITITVVACYVAFYLGDFIFNVSGVLAVVFLGLTVSKNRSAITPSVCICVYCRYDTYKYTYVTD